MLTSREDGRDALTASHKELANLSLNEQIEIDFTDLGTISPGWADEFLSKLQDEFGDRVSLLPTENLSAQQTIKLLESIRGKKF